MYRFRSAAGDRHGPGGRGHPALPDGGMGTAVRNATLRKDSTCQRRNPLDAGSYGVCLKGPPMSEPNSRPRCHPPNLLSCGTTTTFSKVRPRAPSAALNHRHLQGRRDLRGCR